MRGFAAHGPVLPNHYSNMLSTPPCMPSPISQATNLLVQQRERGKEIHVCITVHPSGLM